MTAPAEVWRPVVGFETYYEVSDFGRVRSMVRTITDANGIQRRYRGRIKAQAAARTRRDGKSRYIVTLHKDGVPSWCRVPHLVLNAFVGPCPAGQQGRHLNCDPSDNRLSNLAWGTQQENDADSMRLGYIMRGELHGAAKLTDSQIIEIRELRRTGVLGRLIADQYGVSTSLIYLIAKKKVWSHVGA